MLRLKTLRALPLVWRLAGAAVLTCAAFGVRYAMFGVSPHSPFTLFYPAVVVSALMLGRSAGLLTTALAAAMGLVFVEPVGSLAIPDLEETVGISLFIAVSVFICSVVDRLCTVNSEVATACAVAEQSRAAAEAAWQAEAWARNRAEAGEQERKLLLEEFTHRFKNDLARLSAALALQARNAPAEVARALQGAANRVQGIAKVHEHLSPRQGHVLIDTRGFLEELGASFAMEPWAASKSTSPSMLSNISSRWRGRAPSV